MRKVLFLPILSIAIVSGCITTTVTQQAAKDIQFSGYKTASYAVHTIPTTEFGSDQKFSDGEIDLFDTLLGKKLVAMGYTKPADGQNADFNVDIAITESKEGSGATRFWIGMGAGRAVWRLTPLLTFKSVDGRTIAGFQGGRSYTGMEIGHSFSGKEEIQVSAATRAVSQVEEFIQNNGSFPK
jgi:Domain of unknown function (DUF4410)